MSIPDLRHPRDQKYMVAKRAARTAPRTQDACHSLSSVIAGLDPAIHLLLRKKRLAKKMDPRVKPAGDAREWVSAESMRPGTALAISVRGRCARSDRAAA